MQIDKIEQLVTFDFDGTTIELAKFKNMNMTMRFKDEAMPILVGQLKPFEVFLAAIMNEFAPLKDWGILESMMAAEKDIDKCLLPAFMLMLEYYLPERKYTRDSIVGKIFDLELLYTVVMSQMKLERLLEYHIRRKLSLVIDLNDFAKLGLNVQEWDTKAQTVVMDSIKAAIKRMTAAKI